MGEKKNFRYIKFYNEYFDILKIIILIIVSMYFFKIIKSPMDWHFIDNVNLIFHEAGHIIFSPFGEFVKILGGSIMQILIPLIIFIYFHINNQRFSASIILFWFSQSIINVSIYAKDAIFMDLPLIGGENVIHDWNYIFSNLNILEYSSKVSYYITLIAIIFYILAIIYGLINSRKKD